MAKKNVKAGAATAPRTGGIPTTQLGDKRKPGEVDMSNLSPEQVAQLQLEEAIKESSNPNANLPKLRNPMSLGGCLVNLVIMIVLTIGIALLLTYLWVDKFNIGNILYDMMYKFKIIDLWDKIVDTVAGWFGSGSISAF